MTTDPKVLRGHASSVGSVYASQRAVLSSIFVAQYFVSNQFPSLESAVSRRKSKLPVTGT